MATIFVSLSLSLSLSLSFCIYLTVSFFFLVQWFFFFFFFFFVFFCRLGLQLDYLFISSVSLMPAPLNLLDLRLLPPPPLFVVVYGRSLSRRWAQYPTPHINQSCPRLASREQHNGRPAGN